MNILGTGESRPAILSWIQRWSNCHLSPRSMFWTILIAGFVARMIFAFLLGKQDDLRRYELEKVALSLVQDGVLGNPYRLPTGPSAHIEPAYAFLLAAVFYLFGTGVVGEIVKVGLASLLSTLQYALFPRLTRSLGLGPYLGFWFGLMASLVPLKPETDLKGDWEAPLTAVMLVVCTIGIAELWRLRRFDLANAARQGIWWGIGLLTAPVFLAFYLASVFVGAVLNARTALKPYARFAAVQSLCAFALLAPWVVRNFIQLGSPILTRSNAGLELRLSNNDFTTATERQNLNAGIYERYHPLTNLDEARKVQALGEVAYNRIELSETISWIRAHPARFLSLTAQRVLFFWIPLQPDLPRRILFSCLSLTSIAGVALLLRRDVPAGIAVALPLILQPLPHYLVQISTRYKYPIDWIGILGAAILFAFVAVPLLSRLNEADEASSSA